ncbi:MAG: hypothetical protein U0U69_14670 [Acidimicrobiia bacterium]
MARAQTESQVSRSDIEAKVREIESAITAPVEAAKPSIMATGIVMTVIVVIVAYLFGRRIGTKRSAIVEVKRY